MPLNGLNRRRINSQLQLFTHKVTVRTVVLIPPSSRGAFHIAINNQ